MHRWPCIKCAGITEHELIEVGARDGRVGTRYQCTACGNVLTDEQRVGCAEPFDIADRDTSDRDTKPEMERPKL